MGLCYRPERDRSLHHDSVPPELVPSVSNAESRAPAYGTEVSVRTAGNVLRPWSMMTHL